MRRKIISVLAAACALGASGVLVACGDKNHEHSFAAEWSSDNDGHWHICTVGGCGERGDYAEHDWEQNGEYYDCTVCDYRVDKLDKPDGPDDPNNPDNPDNPDVPDTPDTGDAEFKSVALSAAGVLSWNKIKNASKYVISVTYAGESAPVAYDIDKGKTTQDLRALRAEGFPSGKSTVVLTAYEIDSAEIDGETVEQEVPMTGVSDTFRVTKLNGEFSLVRLKYSDGAITLNGFYSEKVTAGDKEYYLYELALKDNKPTRFDVSKNIKAATGGAYKLYRTAAGRDNESAADELKSMDLTFLSFAHGENMLYARAVNGDDTFDYDLCIYGLYTADVERYASAFTVENGVREYTHEKLGDTLVVTERDIIAEGALYDGVAAGKLGRTADYKVAEKADTMLDLSRASADGMGRVTVKYYFYDEQTVRADVAEYATYANAFGISESDYGISLSTSGSMAGEVVTIPNILVGKRVIGASFFSSEATTVYVAEGATTLVATFSYCHNLKHIWLPSTITTMNEYAFGNSALDTLPTDLTVHCAFERSAASAFPSSWNYIAGKGKPYNTVYGDAPPVTVGNIEYKIKNGGAAVLRVIDGDDVTVPDTVALNGRTYDVTEIASISARGTVKIGKNVTVIAPDAFARSAEKIELDGANTAFAKENGVLFTADKSRVVVAETGVSSLFLGESVREIDKNAFTACVGAVVYVTLGASEAQSLWGDCDFDDVRLVYDITDVTEADDYAYAFRSDGTATVLSYNGNAASLTVPSEVRGHTVTEIASGAFKDCAALTEIVIPDSVTRLGNGLFSGCVALKSITLPFLGETASASKTFAQVTGLTDACAVESVTLTAATELHYSAFEGYAKIKSISLPDTLASASGNAFNGCAALRYAEYGNALYLGNAGNGYLLLVRAKSADITACDISDGARIIADNAFKDCAALKSLVVPKTVVTINRGALGGCTGLKSLTVPFAGTRRATSRTEEGLRLAHIFGDSIPSSLASLTIDGCEHVSKYALSDARDLTEVVFGDSVTGAGVGVLFGCVSVKRVSLGAKFVYLDDYDDGRCALDDCPEIADIAISYSNGKWLLENGVLYYPYTVKFVLPSASGDITLRDYAETIGLAFRNRSGITSLVVPNATEAIARGAFEGCTGLKKLSLPFIGISKNPSDYADGAFSLLFGGASNIPSGLTEVAITGNGAIKMYAFRNCTMLRKVTIGANVKKIESGAFIGCISNGQTTLHEIILENREGWTVGGTSYTAAQLTPYAVAQMMGDTHYNKKWERA